MGERKAQLDGDWDTFTGQAFPEFRGGWVLGEPKNANHVCDRRDIPKSWPRILALDWGYAAPLYAAWGALGLDMKFYIYQEYTTKGAKVKDWAADIKGLNNNDHLDDIVFDWNCFQRTGNEETIAEQFFNETGLRPRPADKGKGSRVATKMLLHEMLRWEKVKQETPIEYNEDYANLLLRTEGIAKYDAYLLSCNKIIDEANIPRLQIFSDCKYLIKTIPLCFYDEKNVEDVAEFEGDDPYDTVRYLINALKTFESNVNKQRLQARLVADIPEHYSRTGDMESTIRFAGDRQRILRGKLGGSVPLRRKRYSKARMFRKVH